MLQDSDRILIEKAVNDMLTDEEHVKLMDRMLEDPEVKEHMEEQTRMVSILAKEDHEALRNVIRHTIDHAPKQIGHFQQYRTYYVAACVAMVLVAVTALFLLLSASKSPKELAIAAFIPYPAGGTSRSEASVDEGLKLYEAGNYPEAIAQLHTQADLKNSENIYNLIIGSAHFQQEHWPMARIFFAPGTQSKDVIIRNEALWLEALTMLASENVQTINKLRAIANNAGPHQKQAAKLLKTLEDQAQLQQFGQ